MRDRRVSSRVEIEAEQGYFISISDLMAGLVFVFIITLSIFALHLNTSQKDYEAELEPLKKERQEQAERLKVLNLKIEELQTLSNSLRKNIDLYLSRTDRLKEQLLVDIFKELQTMRMKDVVIDPDQGILRLSDKILFHSGSADLGKKGRNTLKRLSVVLDKHLACYAGQAEMTSRPEHCNDDQWNPGTLDAVFIEGHTDNIPLSRANPHDNNLHLSGMRAIRTFEYLLESSHVEASRSLANLSNQSKQPVFGISGYGEHRPVVAHEKPTDEPINRRIDMRFLLTNPRPPEIIPLILKELDQLTLELEQMQ
ncbi:MAG: OmpA family protein [Magnetococcales bacterium]|nr:OmpA family protein [Magnetococcales bacterium]